MIAGLFTFWMIAGAAIHVLDDRRRGQPVVIPTIIVAERLSEFS